MDLSNSTERIIKQIITSWQSGNKAYTDFFSKYREKDYQLEVAPERNRAIYLLGHLIATNDGILPLFGLGEKLFPELAPFSHQADRSFEINDSLEQLLVKWQKVNTALTQHFNTMSPADWLSKHEAVSAEDFTKEPHRNKLNVLLGRTNHQSYHFGQLNLLTVKEHVI